MSREHIVVDELTRSLLTSYRGLIEERYEYDNLVTAYPPVKAIPREILEGVRAYFLEYVYPDVEQRIVLNDAFDSLEGHFKNPGHLLQIFADASSLVFRFGLQFPKAMRAGLNTLKTFRSSIRFESFILDKARDLNIEPPTDSETIRRLVSTIPPKSSYGFIKDFETIFSALSDLKLLEKTVGVIRELIQTMKKHPKVYSEEEIAGIQVGFHILDEGLKLFRKMDKFQQETLREMIPSVERSALDKIYLDYKSDSNKGS